MFTVNFWAVLVAALASMVLGALWYSPLLFGNTWMRMMGIKKPDMKGKESQVMQSYLAGLISALVTNAVLAIVIGLTGMTTVSGGIVMAFLVWFGFVATYSFGSVLWESRTPALWALNNAYNLISLLIAGAIIGAW